MNKIKKIFSIFTTTLLSFMFIAAGFTFIVMGVYLLPAIQEQLINQGRKNIELFSLVFTAGIAGGSMLLAGLGIEKAWGGFKNE